MAEQWGDALAIEVSKRIGRFVDASSDLDNLPAQDGDDGRLFAAMADRSLWIYDKDSSASSGTYVRVPADARATGRFVRIDATLAASVAGLVSDVPGLTCLSGDAVGDWVYISGASTVAKADADAPLTPAIGVIVSKETTTSCTVRVSGLMTGLTGLTAGSIHYLSATAGAITATAPAAPNAIPVGVAVSTTSLLVMPTGATFKVLRALGLLNGTRTIPIPLGAWREVTSGGDVGNVAAIGGVLASDTAPILRGDSNNSWEISWATGNVDPIGVQVPIPYDLDDTANVTLHLAVYSGSSDAATMGVASSWDGGSEVTDSADDSGTKSATRHVITATIAAADVPASASHVTLRLTPPTHATNAIQLCSSWLSYTPKAA